MRMPSNSTSPLSASEVEALLAEIKSADRESTTSEWQSSVTPSERSDPVNPSHYKKGDIECIDAIKAMLTPDEWRGFLKGTAVAYLWRLGHKDAIEQDAGKTLWYVSWLANKDPRG
jgi:hypothetical protein